VNYFIFLIAANILENGKQELFLQPLCIAEPSAESD